MSDFVKDTNVPVNDLISRQDAIRWVKTECNPYGNPTLDYESGIKVIKYLERVPSEQLERKSGADMRNKDSVENEEVNIYKMIAHLEELGLHQEKHINIDELKEWVENWLYKDRYYHNGRVSKNIPITELYDILEQMPPVDEEKIATEYCKKKGLGMIPLDYWEKVIAYENRDTVL